MKNARGDGRTMLHTAAADITSGSFVEVGDIVGVAAESVLTGEVVTLFIEGEYEGPTSATPALGAGVEWNGTAWITAVGGQQGVLTRDAGGNVGWIKLTP